LPAASPVTTPIIVRRNILGHPIVLMLCQLQRTGKQVLYAVLKIISETFHVITAMIA
jgi:hypothetical protein